MPTDETADLIIEHPSSSGDDNNNDSGDKTMPMEAEDYAALRFESHGNILANNRNGRDAGTLANNVLQAAMARNFDELGVKESRANSGLIATPIASPTTS